MSRQDRRIARGKAAELEAERIIMTAYAKIAVADGFGVPREMVGAMETDGYVPPCPCECNASSGDRFCGGCGHAGCGGRRKDRA